MHRARQSLTSLAFAAAMLSLAGCAVSDVKDQRPDSSAVAAPSGSVAPAATDAPPGMPAASSAPAPAPEPASKLRVEVNLAARRLTLFEDGKAVETHPVAVGSDKWPTQTGEWKISQVIFNPEWIPPDESWAEEREPKKPGAPNNPLGRAQLIYDPPRTIHGTNDPASIGKAVSHGSIRMANAEIVALAKRIMAASGAPKDDAWFRRAAEQRSEKQVVDLPTPVPIKVF